MLPRRQRLATLLNSARRDGRRQRLWCSGWTAPPTVARCSGELSATAWNGTRTAPGLRDDREVPAVLLYAVLAPVRPEEAHG